VEQGVVVAPSPLSGRHRGRPAVVAAAMVAVLTLALAKPWGSDPAADPVLSPLPNAAGGVAGATPRASVVPTEPPPAWPAVATILPQSVSPTTIQGAAALLVVRAGAWGVGAGGSGPRLIRDEIWADWVAVTPRPVSARAQLETTTAGQLCAGLPTLVDRPSVIAVTAPAGLPPAAWHLVGWWSDGGPSTPLDPSVRQVTFPGAAGVSVLERADQAMWPSGRYEFQLSAGRTMVALSVCLDAAS
jgi:hypothetical protein